VPERVGSLFFYGGLAQLARAHRTAMYGGVACSSHVPFSMNEDSITFAYIANREHGRAVITKEQYKSILNIIYGKEKA